VAIPLPPGGCHGRLHGLAMTPILWVTADSGSPEEHSLGPHYMGGPQTPSIQRFSSGIDDSSRGFGTGALLRRADSVELSKGCETRAEVVLSPLERIYF